MTWTARTVWQVALGCGLLLIGVGVVVVWQPEPLERSGAVLTRSTHAAEGLAAPITRAEFEAIKAEMERLQGSRDAWEHMATTMQRELTALRASLPQTAQQETSRTRTTRRARGQHAAARRGQLAAPGQDEAIQGQAPTPEEEAQHADERTQAQFDLVETTLLTEQVDPTWAPSAEQALHEVFHRQEIAGLHLGEAACHTTLCRLALTLDNAIAPEESLHALTHLAPWSGQGLMRIDRSGSGEVLLYLAREGFTLPHPDARP